MPVNKHVDERVRVSAVRDAYFRGDFERCLDLCDSFVAHERHEAVEIELLRARVLIPLNRADRALADAAGRQLVPVLVFDQFEEMFTLGLAREASRGPCQAFLGELAELIENRPPEAVAKAIEADPEVIDTYLFDRGDYRIVLALRFIRD